MNLDRSADLLTEYKTHTGAFVFHCHKLTHEDHGMMELLRICDPAEEDCDTLCDGAPCGWDTCAPGDTDCERAVALTTCLVDPDNCPEAIVRCAPCMGDDMTCPPSAYCADEPGLDGVSRCVPGCRGDADCADLEACVDGECRPAPCAPPCMPGTRCVHGRCE